jgi:hypothetical protein
MRDVEDGCIVLSHHHGRVAVVADKQVGAGDVLFLLDGPDAVLRSLSTPTASVLVSIVEDLLSEGLQPVRAHLNPLDAQALIDEVSTWTAPWRAGA